MTTTRIGITVTSIQAAKENYAYGPNLSLLPVKTTTKCGELRAAVPSSIPKNAVVTSAKVWVNQYDAWSGSITLTLLRNLAAYRSDLVTWDNQPSSTTSGTQTKSSPAAGTWWSIDVTADLQAIIAGTRLNYGWRLATSSSAIHKVRTQRASDRNPYLELVYQVPARVPTDLAPQGGAVSVADPVLTFSCGDDITAVQVQVDDAADSVSPGFDSGEVAATAGVLDLSATAYAGLADGDTTFWRARAKSASGWSVWSTWVSFSRADLEVAALTSPVAAPADGTPPFEWTFTGTQTAWQATLLDSHGTVLDDSGLVSGADTAWTPTHGLKVSGASGAARVRLYDDVLRIATSGEPIYAEDTVDITVTFDATVDPMDTLVATVTPNVPGIVLTGTRSGGAPDEVIIFRDGVQVARLVGTDVFTGTAFAYTDWSAPRGTAVTYRVAPVVDAAVASTGPTDSETAAWSGIWLIDPATGTKAVLVDRDEGAWNGDDLATVHMPVADGMPPVRRRLRRGVLSGSLSGRIVDALTFTAASTVAALAEFDANDAGTKYRLVAGSLNAEVIVGDILVTPTPVIGSDKAQFNFWGV